MTSPEYKAVFWQKPHLQRLLAPERCPATRPPNAPERHDWLADGTGTSGGGARSGERREESVELRWELTV